MYNYIFEDKDNFTNVKGVNKIFRVFFEHLKKVGMFFKFLNFL